MRLGCFIVHYSRVNVLSSRLVVYILIYIYLPQIIELRKHILDLFGAKLKPGFNPEVSHVRFNLEPVSYIHKPLITYLALNLVDQV